MSVTNTNPSPRRRTAARIAAVAATAMILPLSAIPAHAAPLRPGPYFERPNDYADSFEFDPECRGVDATVAAEVTGRFSARHVLGSGGQAFFGKDRHRFREVWTDDATGKVLLVHRGRVLFQETAARRVANSAVPRRLVPARGLKGPIFEFTSTETGASIVKDGAGRLLYWSGGTVGFKLLFDTRGDSEPGGIPLRFRVTDKVGPHPLLEVDLCDVAAEQAARG